MTLARRAFLRASGAAIVTAAGIAPALATAPARLAARHLKFENLHTGETLALDYWADGAYQPQALEAVNHVLRDFRTGEVHAIDQDVLDILFDLQVLMNREEPYQVISGYRSPSTNAALRRRSTGVAEHSQHMLGKAIDVRVGGFATRRLHELALQMARGGVGFYPASDFVHLDCGRVRSW